MTRAEVTRRWRAAGHGDDPALWAGHIERRPRRWLPWAKIILVFGALVATGLFIAHFGA